jgi:hypothetical protein
MSEDLLARFYRAAGYRVIHSERGTWFDASSRVYQSLPGVKLIDPAREELRSLLRRHRLAGVQYATGAQYGLPSYAYAVRDKRYGLSSTSRTFRQNVLKGARECEVRELGFDELERIGLPVNRDALGRRGYRDPRFLEPDRWRRYCAAGLSTPGAGALGSFRGGALAAYILHVVDQGICHGLHMFSSQWARPHHPNHVLYYEFTRRMISLPDVDCVSTGLKPYPAAGEIDRFKRQAGYRTEPCRLAVVLHPAVERLLLSSPQAALLRISGKVPRWESATTRMRAVAEIARATLAGG